MTQEIAELKKEIAELRQKLKDTSYGLKKEIEDLREIIDDLKSRNILPEQTKETDLERFFENTKSLVLEYKLNINNWTLEGIDIQQKEITENKLIEEFRILEEYLDEHYTENSQKTMILNKLHNNYLNLNPNHELYGKNLLQILVYCNLNRTLKEFLKQFDFLISELSMDKSRATVLHWAICVDNFEGFKIILDAIKNKFKFKNNEEKTKYVEYIFYVQNCDNFTVTDFAIWKNYRIFPDEIFSFFADNIIDIIPDPTKIYSKKSFADAIEKNKYESLSSLLKYDVGKIYVSGNIGKYGETPLFFVMNKIFILIENRDNYMDDIDRYTLDINMTIDFAILLIESGANCLSDYKLYGTNYTSKNLMQNIISSDLDIMPLDIKKLNKLNALFKTAEERKRN